MATLTKKNGVDTKFFLNGSPISFVTNLLGTKLEICGTTVTVTAVGKNKVMLIDHNYNRYMDSTIESLEDFYNFVNGKKEIEGIKNAKFLGTLEKKDGRPRYFIGEQEVTDICSLRGSKWEWFNSSYVMGQISTNQYTLINIASGMRLNEPNFSTLEEMLTYFKSCSQVAPTFVSGIPY